MLRRTLSSLLLLGAAAGCTANDPTLGGALRHNYALQVINPDPKPTGEAGPGTNGVQAAAAADRYNKGTVKPPQAIKTNSGTTPR